MAETADGLFDAHTGVLSIPHDPAFQQERLRLANVRKEAAQYSAQARTLRSQLLQAQDDAEALARDLEVLDGKTKSLETQASTATGARRTQLEAKAADLRALHEHQTRERAAKQQEIARLELELGEAELKSDEFAQLAESLARTEQKQTALAQARAAKEAAMDQRAVVARKKLAQTQQRAKQVGKKTKVMV